VISWHGFLSFVAVALAIYLVAYWASKEGIPTDPIYTTAVYAIIGGIVGARLFHVIDEWRFYLDNPGQIIAIWTGGIAIWGAVLGGLAGGLIGARLQKLPIGKVADLAGMAMILAMAVGRIGDIINGEHVSRFTNMPWGFVWSNPASPTFQVYGLASTHPVVVYEMIWDLILFWLLYRYLWKRLKPDGMVYVAFLAFYAFGRFFISFYRLDREWIAGLTEAQLISIGVMLVTVPLLAYRARFEPREPVAPRSPFQRPTPLRRYRRS
ncbi:MAG: prolipoprotein diacylglyceryl transferase, partial [Chloroflexi bacterium]|nr:prolipoprotein diacylglyceryl transferase [Chloroflexota bacterium]